ncbi:MAG: homoserine dehydrogenase [Chloroflexi bacterium]|nr:homoserine dehydrogenase [Chloroflexota bacterium]
MADFAFPRILRYNIFVETQKIPTILIGLGNIGRGFLKLLRDKGSVLRHRYGLEITVVGAADTSGAAWRAEGLDLETILSLKKTRRGIAAYPECGHPGLPAIELVRQAAADLLIEASPVNLRDGQPGLGCIETALKHDMDVVTANKGPLVLAYSRLMKMAADHGRRIAFSATVAGGCPVLNIGSRDLVGATVERVEGCFNSTTTYILTRMLEEGLGFDEAVHEAQKAGIAEADPSLDIDGWDAANKLVIVANAVLGVPATLADVEVTGIRALSLEDLRRASEEGRIIRLVATAEREHSGYRLRVSPQALEHRHPLAGFGKWGMGVVYYTDTMGVITSTIEEEGPGATCAAVLRDVINLYR